MKDEKLKKEVEKFYEGRNGICCNCETESSVDFINGGFSTINGYFKSLFNQKYKPEDILVLVPNSKGPNNKDEVYQKLDDQLKLISIASKEIEPNKMTITTYHSSKGLECKVCILLNVDNLRDKKLLYVGMTRASERLCIHSFSLGGGKTFKELLSCYEEITTAYIKSDIPNYVGFDPDIEEPSYIENVRKKYPNAYKPWVKSEESELIYLYSSEKSIEEIAESLGRQKGGIISKLKKLGIISNDNKPTKKSTKDKAKYPMRSEHLIEHNLWEDERKLRYIDLEVSGTEIEDLPGSSIAQKDGPKSAFKKLPHL
jgi:hypothetical protein